MSPRKAARASTATVELQPDAVNSARQLLLSFIMTNSPDVLAAALPRYWPPGEQPPVIEGDKNSTPIYNQSVAMISERSCWRIIQERYIMENTRMALLASPKGKIKSTRLFAGRESSFADLSMNPHTVDESKEDAQVGKDSWFLLEWLIRLFQKDSDSQESQGQRELWFLVFMFRRISSVFVLRTTLSVAASTIALPPCWNSSSLGRVRGPEGGALRAPTRRSTATETRGGTVDPGRISPPSK